MKPALVLLVVLSVSGVSTSQDVKLREEAVRLLERANAASASPKLPNLERVDTFRAFGDAAVQEGSFSRVVIQGTGRREEYIFGDYHLLNVWTQKQVAVTGTPHMVPTELRNLLRITPIWHVQFDGEDVIHAIAERQVTGHAARCISFDTIRGQRTDNNEICVDAASGVIVLEKLGAELVEYSEFFQFAGASFPGKISYSQGGVHRMEIAQTLTELTASDANVLAPPMNAEMHKICTTYRRPYGISMPQPEPGSGGANFDVVVRAMVGVNGTIGEATIQSSEREDLNPEALTLARKWTFTPSMCDGHPDTREVDFTMHFVGR